MKKGNFRQIDARQQISSHREIFRIYSKLDLKLCFFLPIRKLLSPSLQHSG